MFNPTDQDISFELDDYYSVIEETNNEQTISIKNGFLPGCKMMMLFKK